MKNCIKHLILLASSIFFLAGCSLFSSEEDVVTKAELPIIVPTFEPVIAWDRSIGDGVDKYFSQLKPVADNIAVYAASREGDVSAFTLDKGEKLWSVDFSDIDENLFNRSARFSGGIGQDYEHLFIGTENGQVLAINKEDGKLAWIAKVKGEVIAKPVYSNGSLVIHTMRGELISLNSDTGEENWAQSNKQPKLTLRGSATPAIAQGGIVYGRSDGFLSVSLLATGQPLWQLPIARAHGATELDRLTDIDMEPVIYDNIIYVLAYNGSLVAVSLLKGEQLWSQDYSGYNDIALSGKTLYVTDHRSHVFALDRSSGEQLWENKQLAYRNITGVAIANEYIVVGDEDGYLHWLNRDTGEFVAQQELDSDGLYVAPLETDDYLYLQTRSGDLIAIEKPALTQRKALADE
ncbi:MAG: outer membrane protein assembly factor BamB [Psychromonas sp.]|nr:outer membrane protein assembly factor BamB [Psychromonas sp.]